jgi:hypothetical protein
MTAISTEQAHDISSNDEQELKELLDRVLAASTTQPLREDLAKLLPEVEEVVAQSVNAAQKRLTHHVTANGDQLRERLEAELDALRRRLAENIDHSGQLLHDKLQEEFANVRAEVLKLHDLIAINGEALSARLNVQEASIQEHLKTELTSALQSTSEKLLNLLGQQQTLSAQAFSEVQAQQIQASQQSLRWQEDRRARDDRFLLELQGLEKRVSQGQRSSKTLLWVMLVAVAAHGLGWAFISFGR